MKIIEQAKKIEELRKQQLQGRSDVELAERPMYRGEAVINGELKRIFSQLEKITKNGKISEIVRFYEENGEFLGANNKQDLFNFVTLREKYEEDKALLNQLKELEKQDGLNLGQIAELESIAETLNINERDIIGWAEIDAEKRIDMSSNERETPADRRIRSRDELDEQEKEHKREINDQRNTKSQKDENNGKQEISKKEIEKISTKTEINPNQKVTYTETMASILEVQGKGYQKIAIVNTDKLKDTKNTARFSIVGIKSDGSAEQIDSLEQDYGTEPIKNINQINRDGTRVERENVNAIYRIKGKSEYQIGITIGSHGVVEPSLHRTPFQENKEALSFPIPTQRNISVPTSIATKEVERTMDRGINARVGGKDDSIAKIKEHEEYDGEKIDARNIDDNEQNDTHFHISPDDTENIEACAREVLQKSDKVANIYNQNDVEKVMRAQKSNTYKSKEEFVDSIKEQMESSAELEHDPHEHGNDH